MFIFEEYGAFKKEELQSFFNLSNGQQKNYSKSVLNYRIRPNYRTVSVFFIEKKKKKKKKNKTSENLKLVVTYIPTCTKGILKKKLVKDSPNDAYTVCFFFFFYIYLFFNLFIKTYVVVTYLNCIGESMHLKWIPTAYIFMKR